MNKHQLQILLLSIILLCSIYLIPVPYALSGNPTISAQITQISFDTRPTGSTIQQNKLKFSVYIWNKSPISQLVTYKENQPVLVQLTSPDPLLKYFIASNITNYYLSISPGNTITTLSVDLVFSQIIFGGVAPYGIYTFELNLCLTRELFKNSLCSVNIANDPISLVFKQNQSEFKFPIADDQWGQVTPQLTIHELFVFLYVIAVYRPLKLLKITRKKNKISLYPNEPYDK